MNKNNQLEQTGKFHPETIIMPHNIMSMWFNTKYGYSSMHAMNRHCITVILQCNTRDLQF